MQSGVSVSRPSGLPQEPSTREYHNRVNFSLDASKSLVDQKTMQLLARLFGETKAPPVQLMDRFARQMTERTLDFLSRAFPDMDADMAFEKAMGLLCKDSWEHCLRVGGMAGRFARELGWGSKTERRLKRAAKHKEGGFLALTLAALTQAELDGLEETMELGGEFHDLGKLAIPEEILNKPGRLTEEEFCVVRLHPVVGEAMMAPLHPHESLLMAVRGHHERWDGKGYPDGLKGADIPLEARLLALVDTFDAMTEQRPYRTRVTWEEAADEILTEAGTQFDPELAEQFVGFLEDEFL